MQSENVHIAKPQIQRLANKAGVTSIGGLSYSAVRNMINSMCDDILTKSMLFMKVAGRKQLSEEDVSQGIFYAYGIRVLYGPKQVEGVRTVSGVSRKKKEGEAGKKEKARRWKSGTVAKRNVKKRQKEHGVFYLSVLPFKRLLYSIYHQKVKEGVIRTAARAIIQLFVEAQIIDLFRKANILSVAVGRKRVLLADIQLAIKMDLNSSCF
jgi:histone H3/H4